MKTMAVIGCHCIVRTDQEKIKKIMEKRQRKLENEKKGEIVQKVKVLV